MQPDLTNLVNLHTIEYGEQSNQTLLILHGLFGSSTNWRSIARELSSEYFVITVDLRNHGQSPWNDSMQYPEIASDVAWLIEQRGLHRPAMLGHSMGGKAAMTLVQAGMSDISKLIVADIAPLPYQHSHTEFIDAMSSVDFNKVKTRNDVENQLKTDIPEPMIRQFLMQNLIRIDSGFNWRINLEAISENMGFILGYDQEQISETETLFIGGGNSNYIVPAVHPEINRLFPSSKFETIEGAGHWLHAEQPDRFIQLVKDFLNP